MTTISTSNMIFIGNLPPIDNDESDWDTDNANSLIGTYSAFSDLQTIAITNVDTNDDGAIYDDEAGMSDYVTYTRDGTNYTDLPDATISYFATVTEDDGTQHMIEVVVVQMTNGDTFVGDMQNLGNLDNLTIRTIELTAPNTTNAAGYNTYQSTSNTFVCYAAGTFIDTPIGKQRVETLRTGDLVLTRDHGGVPIVWIGSSRLCAPGPQAPIQIAPDALGPGQPKCRLRLSPQHRILVCSKIAQRMFGTDEVLIPAKRLLPLPGVSQAPPDQSVRYWHILCDRHEVLRANGLWAESLLPAKQAIASLKASGTNITLTPLSNLDTPPRPSRMIPNGHAQSRLVRRHLRNAKPLCDLAGIDAGQKCAPLRQP